MRLAREYVEAWARSRAVDMDSTGPDPDWPGERRDEYHVVHDRVIRTRYVLTSPQPKASPANGSKWATPTRSRVTAASTIAAVRECLAGQGDE